MTEGMLIIATVLGAVYLIGFLLVALTDDGRVTFASLLTAALWPALFVVLVVLMLSLPLVTDRGFGNDKQG